MLCSSAFMHPNVIANERERLQRLMMDHHTFVVRLLHGLGVPASDADDLAQRTFWLAFRKITEIRNGSERAFLRSIALREAGHLRRTWARRREVSDEVSCPTTTDSVRQDELIGRRQADQAVGGVLDSMSAELRMVLEMFGLQGRTISEISNLLEIPPGTVKTRLRRARREFMAAWTPDRLAPEAAGPYSHPTRPVPTARSSM